MPPRPSRPGRGSARRPSSSSRPTASSPAVSTHAVARLRGAPCRAAGCRPRVALVEGVLDEVGAAAASSRPGGGRGRAGRARRAVQASGTSSQSRGSRRRRPAPVSAVGAGHDVGPALEQRGGGRVGRRPRPTGGSRARPGRAGPAPSCRPARRPARRRWCRAVAVAGRLDDRAHDHALGRPRRRHRPREHVASRDARVDLGQLQPGAGDQAEQPDERRDAVDGRG